MPRGIPGSGPFAGRGKKQDKGKVMGHKGPAPRPGGLTTLPTQVQYALGNGVASLDAVLTDIRALLEARQTEYTMAAQRVSDILAILDPKPAIGRPPKQK